MTEQTKAALPAVWRIDWTEYERGWGSRPDGYSLYINKADAVEAYNKCYEGRYGEAPDDYINASVPRLVEQTLEDARRFAKFETGIIHYTR